MNFSQGLLSGFPSFAKPSYEAFIHKKAEYEQCDLGVAIPSGKRAFLWFTTSGKEKICCIIEIGRNQTLQDNIHILNWNPGYPAAFSLGTLLSGYLMDGDEQCPNHKYFIADDLFLFQGYEYGNPYPLPFAQKFGAFSEFFKTIPPINHCIAQSYSIHSIVMWNRSETDDLPTNWVSRIGYKVKHIQYRSSYSVLPFANLIVSKNPWESGGPQLIEDVIDYVPNSTVWSDITLKYKKEMRQWNVNVQTPIHNRKTLFWVSADITYDIYYLFVQNNVLFQYAFIPDYKTSIMMNKLFRSISENDCLDKVEESDSEEDFENIRDDKYVDLNKRVLMECVFHHKFKKWVPVSVSRETKCFLPRIDEFLYKSVKYNDNTNHGRREQPSLQPHQFFGKHGRRQEEKKSFYKKKN
jgi:hypothetical protein